MTTQEKKTIEERGGSPLCPACKTRCFTPYGWERLDQGDPEYPALSRRDNKTYICSTCGTAEALADWSANQARRMAKS